VSEPKLSADRALEAVISEAQVIFGDAVVNPDDNFFAAGGTSLDAVELAERLQAVHGLDVSLDYIFSARDMRDIAEAALLISHEAGS